MERRLSEGAPGRRSLPPSTLLPLACRLICGPCCASEPPSSGVGPLPGRCPAGRLPAKSPQLLSLTMDMLLNLLVHAHD